MTEFRKRKLRYTGTTYYVDATNGNDSNDGMSVGAAWQTIDKVNAFPLLPGDSVLFKRGETFTTRLTVPSSGQAGRPITFADYGTGPLPIITHATDGGCLLTNVSHINLYNLDLRGGSAFALDMDGYEAGRYVTNVLCVGLIISEATTTGCYIAGDSGLCQNITMQDCTSHSNGHSGFLTGYVTNVTFTDCIGHSNGSTDQHHGIYVASYSDQVTVSRGTFYSNGGHGIQVRNHASNILLDGNACYSNDCNGILVQEFYGTPAIIVQNNLCYSNTLVGISLGATCIGTSVLHNTVVNNADKGIGLEETSVLGNIIKNNLVVQDFAVVGDAHNCIRGPAVCVQGNTFDNNDYIYLNDPGSTPCNQAGSEKTLAQWQALTGTPDAHSISADPVFVTNYTDMHLQTTSPCKAAGDATVGVLTDKDGIVRGAAVDCGCYEFVA